MLETAETLSQIVALTKHALIRAGQANTVTWILLNEELAAPVSHFVPLLASRRQRPTGLGPQRSKETGFRL